MVLKPPLIHHIPDAVEPVSSLPIQNRRKDAILMLDVEYNRKGCM